MNDILTFKLYCLTCQTLVFDDPNNIVSSVEHLCFMLWTHYFVLQNILLVPFTPILSMNQAFSDMWFSKGIPLFGIHYGIIWKNWNALCTPSIKEGVIVYFANRPKMAIFATNSRLDAKEGLLKRFVWRFDTLTICTHSGEQSPSDSANAPK